MVGPAPASLHFDRAPVVDSPPGPRSRELRRQQRSAESSAVLYPHDLPIAFAEGRGATLRDVDDNFYLDFFAGIGVTNVGHANPAVTEAAVEQARRLPHSLDFPTKPRLELLERLNDIAPAGLQDANRVVFGGPTGSDAVEASIKLTKESTGNDGLIAFRGSFHGETAGAFSLTADTSQKRHYTPLLPGVAHATYPYPYRHDGSDDELVEQALAEVKDILTDRYGGLPNPAGVWVEPIQGEGGTVVPPSGFLHGLRDLCDDHNVLLIADEIQTGMARTGDWWAIEHADITPDIMTMGKGLGSGFPLSGTMYSESLEPWRPGGHTGTFRGFNPAMAAAVRTIEYIQEYELLDRATRLGAQLRSPFEHLESNNPHVGDVRGRGMFLGVELVDQDGRPAPSLLDDVRTRCFQQGVLVWAGGRGSNVLRLLPPLVMTPSQIETGTEIICEAIREATSTMTER